jgi:2'-5' RNA ligase
VQYAIVATPPEAYQRRIVAWRSRWLGDGERRAVEPHVTVKAQGGLTDDLAWLDRVRAVCATFSAFVVALTGPAMFGDHVVYLGVESPGIVSLHRRLVEAVAPPPALIEQYFELDQYTPHLTLGQSEWGLAAKVLAEMRAEAARALSPFPTFNVAALRIYRETAPDRYEILEEIRLASNG